MFIATSIRGHNKSRDGIHGAHKGSLEPASQMTEAVVGQKEANSKLPVERVGVISEVASVVATGDIQFEVAGVPNVGQCLGEMARIVDFGQQLAEPPCRLYSYCPADPWHRATND